MYRAPARYVVLKNEQKARKIGDKNAEKFGKVDEKKMGEKGKKARKNNFFGDQVGALHSNSI